jgi:hypothetical protein
MPQTLSTRLIQRGHESMTKKCSGSVPMERRSPDRRVRGVIDEPLACPLLIDLDRHFRAYGFPALVGVIMGQ